MKKLFISGLFLATTFFIYGQDIDAIINAKEVERIERILASDSFQGRRSGTIGNGKAAGFIETEFQKIGLKKFGNLQNHVQNFTTLRPKLLELKANWNGKELDQKQVVVVTTLPQLDIDQNSGYEIISVKPGVDLVRHCAKLVQSKKDYIVFVDESYANDFLRLTGLKRQLFVIPNSVVFILSGGLPVPSNFAISAKHEFQTSNYGNVVAVLPGKKKPEEIVIFSGHFDHLGIGKAVNGDSIYNGANDDAAGTTAVIMLAKYFKALNNNERTIVFAAFDAEEIGLVGSRYFSQQFDADKVVAMFNIEMIGTESKWGRNSAFITGFEQTNMGEILNKNLEGSGFTFYPDPYTEQNLFYRSDNATLARLGVPAHTISTAKMENEPHYHKPSDHIETLDMQNMAQIIKSIAISSKSIIAGKDNPTRVKVEDLR